MKNLQDLRIFSITAQLGSLSACARQLNLSPAVVSAAIKRLEAELDTLLFIRSTRSLRLTQHGEEFLVHCREALDILDDGIAALQEEQSLKGSIQMSAPSDLGRNLILPWLDAFMEEHPDLEVTLNLSDSMSDLYGQTDVAIRYGEPKDSSFVALPIAAENDVLLCVSPDYLKRQGEPKSPKELSEHNCLCLGHNDILQTRWTFFKDGKKITQEVKGNRQSKDGDAIRLWALAGKGIGRKSRLDVASELKSGQLIELKMDGWRSKNYPLNLVCAERRVMSPTIRALREHFSQASSALLATLTRS